MKLGFLGIIICVMTISANQVLALSYQDTVFEENQNSEITDSQISAAELLQDYIKSYSLKVNALHVSYGGGKSTVISNFNFQTGNMYATLKDIQAGNYNEAMSGKIMSEIVSELKTINTRMKVFLEQEKTLYIRSITEKQILLSKIGAQISSTLDTLLLSVSNQLISKDELSPRDKRVVAGLVVLREQNIKMKNFKNIEFESHEQMNTYIRNVIETIRLEFQKIRRL